MSGAGGGRVVLVANNFPPVRGGSAVVYGNLARCAQGRIIVVAPRLGYSDGLPLIGWREHDRLQSYRVLRLPLLRTLIRGRRWHAYGKLLFLGWDVALRLRLAWTLLRLVAFERVRAICVGELLASGWVIHLFRLVPGVRTAVYVHGEEITTDDPYDLGHHRSRRALLASDAIIAVSHFTLRAIEALLGGAAAARTSLIMNGVDTERFSPAEKSAQLLELYGLTGCFVFVSVCRLLEKKGVDHAIAAFARLAADCPACRYLIVGTGPHADVLAELARTQGVADRVVFAGQVAEDELVEHYRLGDVFVMPNRELANGDTEGFGLVFLEANACGLPVIAGCDGGSTDAVIDGVNGLVVDGRSVEAIEAAMRRLHDEPALRAQLRRDAGTMVAAAGWDGKARRFLEICS